jgi:hypothetical protein
MVERSITLRQAALTAGFGVLVMVIAAPFAEFFVYGRLVVSGDVAQTVHNLQVQRGFAIAGLLAYFVTLTMDVLVAWALYLLLAPVSRSLSLLAAWLRLMYTALAFFGVQHLATALRLLGSPDHASAVGSDQLHGQIEMLLAAFRYGWNFGMILFGVHVAMVGYLVYRSSYIPRWVGALMGIAGLGYFLFYLQPFLYPRADLGFLTITFFGEIVFMLWLLVRGWGLREPA